MTLPPNSIQNFVWDSEGPTYYDFTDQIGGLRIGLIYDLVEENAFEDNTSLEEVSIPDDVKILGTDAFNGCDKLSEVKLPSELIRIAESCFWGCESLVEIVIPENTQTIEFGAFEDSSVNKLTLNIENLETVGDYAFDTRMDSRLNRTCYVGNISTLDTANKFPALNGWIRIANYQFPIPDCDDTIPLELTFPSGEEYRDTVRTPFMYRETQPNSIRYLGTGELVTLATLDGTEYEVMYDFGEKSLQTVAREQYPEELSDPWTLELPWEEDGQRDTNAYIILEKLLSQEWDINELRLINWG